MTAYAATLISAPRLHQARPLTPNGCSASQLDGDADGDGILDSLDACPAEDSTGFDIDKDGCIDSVTGISTTIDTLVADGVIDSNLGSTLIKKATTAENSFSKDNICAGIHQFESLINQVNGQRDNKISDAAADDVIAYAQSVIDYYLSQLAVGDTC